MNEQLLLFETSKKEKLRDKIARMKEQCEKMRKGFFIRYTATNKVIESLGNDLERIENDLKNLNE